MRIKRVKSTRKDQGECGRCREPLPKGSAYIWIKFRYGRKQVRCTKASCMFRQSDLTSSDKLSRAYAAGETVEDALNDFALEVHVNDILEKGRAIVEAVDEALYELQDVADEYNEGADAQEDYFPGSPQIDESREKAESLEAWRDELESPKDDLEGALEELETYIGKVQAYREEHDVPEDADIIVTTVEGLTDMMFDEEGNLEPFDTSEIASAIDDLATAASSCPI